VIASVFILDDRVEIPRVSWHVFRYTYSTSADPSGESIKTTQAQLGHPNAKLTLSVCIQPMPEAQRHVAAKVARVLLPIAPKSEDGAEEAQMLRVLIQ
jgi:hypothetical protein